MTRKETEGTAPQHEDDAPGWPFPFADATGGALTRRQWGLLVAAFLALHYASLAVAVWTGNFDPSPNSDHQLVMHDILATGAPRRAIWPPGFGYYLTLSWILTEHLGLPFWCGKLLLDPLLVIASGVTSTFLGQLLTRNRTLAVTSGVGLVAAPIFLFASAEGLAVLLFQPFFLASLAFLVRALQQPARAYASMAVAGCCMGLACLVRANPQFLIMILGPVMAWVLARQRRRRPLRRAAAMLGMFVIAQWLIMAPWLAWQRGLGRSGFLAAPTLYHSFLDGLERYPGNPLSDWVREHDAELPRTFDTIVDVSSKWLREDPGAVARLFAHKVIRTWYFSDSGRWDRAIAVVHAPWWIGALVGLWVWARRCRADPALALLLCCILYMWGVSIIALGLARYMAPVYGFLGLLSGSGWVGWSADRSVARWGIMRVRR